MKAVRARGNQQGPLTRLSRPALRRCRPWLSAVRNPRAAPAGWTAIGIACLFAAGCARNIDSTYGRRAGEPGGKSVNGTAVLARMFEQAGHPVSSTTWLTPSVSEKAEVIVWFPDDFAPPSQDVRDWFATWFEEEPDRILVYVGRDFDAAPNYWAAIQPGAPAEQRREIKRLLGGAQNDYQTRRREMPPNDTGDWFTTLGRRRHRHVRTLSGDAGWLKGVDQKKIEIELNGRLVPPPTAQIVLASQRDMLVSRQHLGEGQLIVVANGSFLLNLPLVNHEHRKLAGKLVSEVGDDRRVVFLQSGPGGPEIFDKDPMAGMRNGLEIFGVAPFDSILVHLAAAGLIFCFARLPIFGPPRSLQTPAQADFGRHVWALGKLLERARDRAYALSRVQHYQQAVRCEPARYRHAAPGADQAGDHEAAPPGPLDQPPPDA